MDLNSIITIIILIVIAIIIFRIVKTILKAVLTVLVLGFLLTAFFGFLTYKDAVWLKDNLEGQPKLMLLQDNKKIVAGFVATDFGEEAELLTISQVAEHQNSFKKQDYKKMLGTNQEMFIIDRKAFGLVDEKVNFNGKELSKNFLYSVLKSNDPINLYRGETGINPALNGISDSVEFKSQVFAVLFSEAIEKKGTLFIFSEYKKKNIIAYPETAVFKFIGLIPTAFIDKMFEEAKDIAINKVNQTIKGD